MLHCPHCSAPITLADLRSRRFFRARTCKACGGQYFEGGTTVAMAIVGAGGGIASSLSKAEWAPPWLPLVVGLGFGLLGVFYTHSQMPRKIDDVRAMLLQALVAAPAAAALVWALVAVVS